MRRSSCACGNLQLTLEGEPSGVYACGCQDCQKLTGTAFAYRARYPRKAITVTGETRSWRRKGTSGQIWLDFTFCPHCGATLFCGTISLVGAVSDWVAISVGAIADQDFPPPRSLYWADRLHSWCQLPGSVARVATQ